MTNRCTDITERAWQKKEFIGSCSDVDNDADPSKESHRGGAM